MIKNVIIIIFFLNLLNSFSQSIDNNEKITMALIMPEDDLVLNQSQISLLETKILQILTNFGISSVSYNNNFIIYPKFEIYETKEVEGTMQNIVVSNCNLTLFVKQIENNLVFSSVNNYISGSGKDMETSISNAISNIKSKDLVYKNFIEDSKNKIINYYTKNCDDIINQSENMYKKNNIVGAIALLYNIPSEVTSCYKKSIEKSLEYFNTLEKINCNKTIKEVKIKIAEKNYIGALEIIENSEPSTVCNDEIKKLIELLSEKIDKEEKQRLALEKEKYNNEINLEKQRIDAIKAIAVSYYNSQPKTISYNYIIK